MLYSNNPSPDSDPACEIEFCKRKAHQHDRPKYQYADLLQTGLRHFLLSWDTVTANSLNTLRVKARFLLIRRFVLETDIALLSHQHARQVNL